MTPSALLYAVETEILKMLAASLGRGAVGTAEWQADRLLRLGVISQRAAAMVSAYRNSVLAGTASSIQAEALQTILAVDARAFAATKLPSAMNDPTILASIEAWQSSALSQMNLAMAQLAQNAGRVYSDIINRTTLSVLTGAVDGHSALVQTIKEWSARGVPSIVDRKGRQWTTEAYADAVLRSNASRVASEVALKRSEEYGTDLVEVSSHPGSRPSHYDYQGKVFSRSGSSEKYPALSETGWGTAGGVGGVNCSHLLYPFWEGISKARGPEQSAKENELLYETSQEQRKLERGIRSAKRELSVMESLKDENGIWEAKQTLRSRQADMREFIDETGRSRRRGREQVYDA